jgi:hypothetical protein
MVPFEVAPEWFDNYWYSDRPLSGLKSFSRSVARLAVLIVLLTSSGMALSHL